MQYISRVVIFNVRIRYQNQNPLCAFNPFVFFTIPYFAILGEYLGNFPK